MAVKVGLAQGERFADPQPGTSEHDDHAAQPDAFGAVAGGAHHGDDLLDGGWVGWVMEPRSHVRPVGPSVGVWRLHSRELRWRFVCG